MKCNCPYCGAEMENKLEFAILSPKRKAILETIIAAGPNGIDRSEIKRLFFEGCNDTTVRTTIYYINKAIEPRKIVCNSLIVRLKIH